MEPARTYWAYLARLLVFIAVVAGIVLLVWYIVSLANDDEPVVDENENEAIEMVGEAIEEPAVVEEEIIESEEPAPAPPPENSDDVAGAQGATGDESLPNTGIGSFAVYAVAATAITGAAVWYRQSRLQLKQSLLE